jgi:hypothetical protein
VVQKKDRALYRRIVEVSLEVDLAYGTNVAPTILSADEYRQNQEYGMLNRIAAALNRRVEIRFVPAECRLRFAEQSPRGYEH